MWYPRAMKRTNYRFMWVLGSLAFGAALAETPTLKSTMPGNPKAVLSMYADEPIMYRAIRRARKELDEFLVLAESPKYQQEHFAVRVGLMEPNARVYIWVTDFKKDDTGLYAGVVDDDLHVPTNFKRGDRFTFIRGDIVDWTYTDTRKGRVYGAYTECALLTLAPADVAAQIRKDNKLDCEF